MSNQQSFVLSFNKKHSYHSNIWHTRDSNGKLFIGAEWSSFGPMFAYGHISDPKNQNENQLWGSGGSGSGGSEYQRLELQKYTSLKYFFKFRHLLKQTLCFQLSLPSQKNMPLSRFKPGSPRPCPKLFEDLDRSAIGPALV